MNDERIRILNMVASGKISAEAAEELLEALDKKEIPSPSDPPSQPDGGIKKMPDYFRVKVVSVEGDNVNIKIPFRILKAGIKLTSLMPPSVARKVNNHLSEKGIDIDFNSIKKEDMEDFLDALSEIEINVDSANGDKVRIFCE